MPGATTERYSTTSGPFSQASARVGTTAAEYGRPWTVRTTDARGGAAPIAPPPIGAAAGTIA